MKSVGLVLLGILCFLVAIRCLFAKVNDPPPDPKPDAVDRFAYKLIFRKDLPPPRASSGATNLVGARIVGFLLFAILGVVAIYNR